MLYRILTIILLFIIFTNYSYSAATSGGNSKSNYDQAVKLIETAKKYENKGKDEKAKKRYERALKLSIRSKIDQLQL